MATGTGFKGGFPAQPTAPDPFMPMTTDYEAARRMAEDRLAAAKSLYNLQVGQIGPQLQQGYARNATDRQNAARSLDDELAGRGMFTSGVRTQLQERDVATPYARADQDLAQAAAEQYMNLGMGLADAQLAYNQDIMQALLDSANSSAADPPLSAAQYGYDLEPQRRQDIPDGKVPKTDKPRRKKDKKRNR